jgi:hypothetical protein
MAGPGAFADLVPEDADIADAALPIIQPIESGGAKNRATVVSPKGAVGIGQVMPNTAIQYGYDPEKLTDADYNSQVSRTILADLADRYKDAPNRMDAVWAGYNGGPGRGDALVKTGNPGVLPQETQDYILKANKQITDGAFTDLVPEQPALPATPGAFDDLVNAPSKAQPPADPFADMAPKAAPAGGGFTSFIQDILGGTKLPDPSKPQDTFMGTMKKTLENVPQQIMHSIGGTIQKMGETPAQPNIDMGAQDITALQNGGPEIVPPGAVQPESFLAAGRENSGISRLGKAMAAKAQQHLKENAPNVPGASISGFASELTSGVANMVPLMAASALTKSAAPMLIGFGGQAYGEKYAASRAAGRTPEQADGDATFSAAANALPAMLPLHAIMQPGKKFLGKLLPTVFSAATQNVLTTGLQNGYDMGVLNSQMTWGEAVNAMLKSGIIGAATGVGFAGLPVGHAAPEEAPRVEPTAASAGPDLTPGVQTPIEPAASAPGEKPITGPKEPAASGAQKGDIGAQSEKLEPVMQPPAGTPKEILDTVHDPETWVQTGWKDKDGNILPLDDPRARAQEAPARKPTVPLEVENPPIEPSLTDKVPLDETAETPVKAPESVDTSAENAAKPIENDDKHIGIDTAKAALVSNIDPATGKKPKGNAALRDFRARMQGVVDAVPAETVSRETEVPATEPKKPTELAEKVKVPATKFDPAAYVDEARAVQAAGKGAIAPAALAKRIGTSPARAARVLKALADAKPDPHFDDALGRVRAARAPMPKSEHLGQAIRSLGGLKLKDNAGNHLAGGPEIRDILDKNPGLLNNKTGLAPDAMREALSERGWFSGANDAEHTGLDDLHEMLSRHVKGEKIYHPTSDAANELHNRAMLDEELGRAGVGAADSDGVAARKLAEFRKEWGDALADRHEDLIHENDVADLDAADQKVLHEDYDYEPGSDVGEEHEAVEGASGRSYESEDFPGWESETRGSGEEAGRRGGIPEGFEDLIPDKAEARERTTPESDAQHIADVAHAKGSEAAQAEFYRLTPKEFVKTATGAKYAAKLNREVQRLMKAKPLAEEPEGLRNFEKPPATPDTPEYRAAKENLDTARAAKNQAAADFKAKKITPAQNKKAEDDYMAAIDAVDAAIKPELKTEDGDAVDGGGKIVPQTVAPGADHTAQQLAKAREASGKGKIKPKAAQKEATGGLFGEEPKAPETADMFAEKPSDYGTKNTVFTADAAQKARDLIRNKLKNQMSSGIDPEMVHAGITLAGYHVEAGARKFADFAKAMLDDLGENARPFLKMWYNAVRDYPGFEAEGMSDAAELTPELIASAGKSEAVSPDVFDRSANSEQDRGADQAEDQPGAAPVSNEPGQAARGAGAAGKRSVEKGRAAKGGGGADERGPVSVGERGDREIREEEPELSGHAAGPGERAGGGDYGDEGIQPDRIPAETVDAAAPESAHVEENPPQQSEPSVDAPKASTELERALPTLFPEQRDDVAFAEQRFSEPDGHGVLFTNGTGTGKTFTGGGIIKRAHDAGHRDILVVAPTQGILDHWVEAAEKLGVPLKVLDDTASSGGKGPVATTYANFQQNKTLADRDWSHVIADESHTLMSQQDGAVTQALRAMRALTNHPSGYRERARMQLRKYADPLDEMVAQRKAMEKAKMPLGDLPQRIEAARLNLEERMKPVVEKIKGQPRTKVAFLSATPFAYDKNVDYAEGYLFSYGPEDTRGGYNSGSPHDRFFMQHFGYRMKYGKLTKPEAAVQNDVMERQFHEYLRHQKVLSGRVLTVDKDYDRKFMLVDDGVGKKIDQALEWLDKARETDKPASELGQAIRRRFDYLARMRLLEAIKATHAVDVIKKHMAMGRKVVVFHDFNEGGGFNPFTYSPDMGRGTDMPESEVRAAYDRFVQANPYVEKLGADMARMRSPLETLQRAFPDALIYNGTVSKKVRSEAKAKFNTDGTRHNLIVVQSAAGQAGISLHDTSGKHQRVLINLGMPGRPVAAIQIEGRTYRIGQASDAVFRYMNTGTSWERHTFASRLAERAGTAENLALGDRARTLRQSFIDAFNDSAKYPPSAEDGRGGKEIDRALYSSHSEFQRAKSFYYAQGKKKSGRNNREGVDYYATPEPIGYKMVEWAGIRPGDKVLEPSAGHGAIARFFPDTSDRTLVEPSAELATRAVLSSPGADVKQHRFEDLHIVNKYDAIVMNPPFGAGGSTAIAHIAKAATHLRDGGRIVALIPEGPAADKKFNAFMESEAAKGIYQVGNVRLPQSTFERAGTKINSRVVILERQNTEAGRDRLQDQDRDFSDAANNEELFNRIEHSTIRDRVMPVGKEEAPAPALASARNGGLSEPRTLAPGEGSFDLAETKHTKTGDDLYVATFKNRVERDTYSNANSLAKRFGGYYSAFRGKGAIPGFQFKTAEAREAFVAAHDVPVNPAFKRGDQAPRQMRGARTYPGAPGERAEAVWTPEFDAAREKFEPELRKRLDQVGLKDVRLDVPDRINATVGDVSGEALGLQFGDVIAVAMDNNDGGPHAALNHEMIHQLRGMKVIPEDEWSILERRAPEWRKKYQVDSRYGKLSEARLNEEAIAHAFPDFVAGKLGAEGNAIKRAFTRVKRFFEAVRNAMHGLGFKTAEDVFAKIDRGDYRDAAETAEDRALGINLNRKQRETPEFRRWFGDSEAVDEEGRPKVYYHGTNAEPFDSFQKTKGRYGRKAFYFHPDEGWAGQYGKRTMGVYLKAEKVFDWENPDHMAIAKKALESWDGYEPWMSKELAKGDWEELERKPVQAAIKAGGFDSYFVNDHPGKAIAVFDPKQIKSATDNRGTFDPNSKQINLARKKAPEEETPRPRSIMGKIDKAAVDKSVAVSKALGDAVDRLMPNTAKSALADLKEWSRPGIDAMKMASVPMANGTPETRAAAKDFANGMREARVIGGRQDDYLNKNFTPEQRARMWNTADEESVALQEGRSVEGIGLSRLPAEERKVVEAFQMESNATLQAARDVGMFKGEGLPSYMPRMVVAIASDGKASRLGYGGDGAHGLDSIGRNLKTTSSNLKQRKHLTVEQTEEAAKALDPNAVVVRDIRTLPLAMARLREAIAGRKLINTIREMGEAAGEQTISEGAEPEADGTHTWFTIDHPAMKTYRPKFFTNEETGKIEVLEDEHGNPLFERVPLYIRGDFEGPLRAVLTKPSNAVVKALMTLKGKTMSVIMYSPMMHNAVIWGKALPAAPLKLITPWYRGADGNLRPGLQLYGEGRVAKNNPVIMKEALRNGLDPIGKRYGIYDATGIIEDPTVKPGRSWTAQILAYVPGLFDKSKGDAVKRYIDKAGDVWHNKLLWDLVGDLQMGLYQTMRDKAVAAGHDPQTAGRMAAHFANRYAGALPIEAMSQGARTVANFLLFSRSFTMTNLGAFKDVVSGLPRDIQAQIIRDRGIDALNQIQGTARRKAAVMLGMDIVLSHVGTFLAAYAIAWAAGAAFQPPSENEPGKDGRFLIGYQKDGTAIYGRLPTGKVGEDLQDWVGSPVEVGHRKLSPFGHLIDGIWSNDKGFGQKIYDPYDATAAGYAKNMGRLAEFAMEAVMPLSPFKAIGSLGSNKGEVQTKIEQILLPMIGITVSKGAPGGPAMGQLYASRDEHEFQVGEKMPEIKEKIASGDVHGATKMMTELGMSRSYQRFILKTTKNPRARLSKSQMREFMGYATPEEKAKMRGFMDADRGRRAEPDEEDNSAPADQRSELTPQGFKASVKDGTVQKFAAAGGTWTQEQAARAAQAAGMTGTAAILRSVTGPIVGSYQNSDGEPAFG